MRTVAFLFSFIAANAASADIISGSKYGYKLWEGAAYTDEQTGQFSHCVVSAPYQSGDVLLLSLTKSRNLIVSISNEAFNFEVGANLPVTINIDRRPSIYATANPVTPNQLVLLLPNFDQSMNYIQMGRTMQITGRQFSGVYDLTGTKVALERTYTCAARYYDFTLPQTTEVGLSKTELFQVATNMITSINASDAKYLDEKQISEMGFGTNSVFWISESLDIMAGTLTTHRPSADLRATDSQDIEFISNFCKGDFASSSQKVSHIVGVEQRRLHGICRESDKETHIIATKTDLGEHTLYNLIFFFNSEKTDDAQWEEATGNIAIYEANYAKN